MLTLLTRIILHILCSPAQFLDLFAERNLGFDFLIPIATGATVTQEPLSPLYSQMISKYIIISGLMGIFFKQN